MAQVPGSALAGRPRAGYIKGRIMGTGDNGEKSVLDKKTKKIIWGTLAAVLLAGIIFFFSFFQVRTIEVMGSTHYSQDQVKEMALQGSFMNNTVLQYWLHSFIKMSRSVICPLWRDTVLP